MGSKEARNSLRLSNLHFLILLMLAILALKYIATIFVLRLWRVWCDVRLCSGAQRRRGRRATRPGGSSPSTGGGIDAHAQTSSKNGANRRVRLRLASTIHSKFVFSRNRTVGLRPSDRLPERAPTCSARGPLRMQAVASAAEDGGRGSLMQGAPWTAPHDDLLYNKRAPAVRRPARRTRAPHVRSRRRPDRCSRAGGEAIISSHHPPLSPPAG